MSETRKLAAILVADVVGYSRLAGADAERKLARLPVLCVGVLFLGAAMAVQAHAGGRVLSPLDVVVGKIRPPQTGFAGLRPPPCSPDKPGRFPGRQKPP